MHSNEIKHITKVVHRLANIVLINNLRTVANVKIFSISTRQVSLLGKCLTFLKQYLRYLIQIIFQI